MIKRIRVAVIGAGPAGMSAALWLKNLGMSPVVIEKTTMAGGMLNVNFLENDWVLGQRDLTGVELAKNFQQHIVSENIDLLLEKNIQNIQKNKEGFLLGLTHANSNNSANERFGEKQTLDCDAIIFAAGTRYVDKNILCSCEGFSDIDSRQVIEGPYAFLHMEQLTPQRVLIIGAGDNAFENAMMLLERGFTVTIVARSEPKAQIKFLDAVMDHSCFTLLTHVPIEKMKFSQSAGDNGNKESVLTVDGQCLNEAESKTYFVPFDRLHILAGYQPNADRLLSIIDTNLRSSIEIDDNGFVVVDASCHTTVKGLYAAGDIANTQFPCVVSAIALGAQAAKSISQDFAQ